MRKLFPTHAVLATALLVLAACSGGGSSAPSPPSAEAQLATTIRNDTRLPLIRSKAKTLIAKNLSAGDFYPAVFIRDLNTFIEVAIETHGGPDVRAQLRMFLDYQAADGGIVDGIYTNDGTSFKATVESDQESSLMQAVAKYVAITGDKAFLNEVVRGTPVIVRLENSMNFLYAQRYSSKYGMIWGATRADWGDVQPEDANGTILNDASHPAISIYDNAMATLALMDLQTLEKAVQRDPNPWALREQQLRTAIRTYLWTGTQFIPHLYLEKGGTAVAIQAGLLTPGEVTQAFTRMIKNKVDSNSRSVGVSLYPPYPAGFFKNTEYMGSEYQYQNGGDWPWFGARIIQQMMKYGQVDTAYKEFDPMLNFVMRDDAFYEWFKPDGTKMGSGDYRGTAGQMVLAIDLLTAWAAKH